MERLIGGVVVETFALVFAALINAPFPDVNALQNLTLPLTNCLDQWGIFNGTDWTGCTATISLNL